MSAQNAATLEASASSPFAPAALIHLLLRQPRKRALRQAEACIAAISSELRQRAKNARADGATTITVTVASLADLSEGYGAGYQAEFKRALSKLAEAYPKSFKNIEIVLDYTSDTSLADLFVVMDPTLFCRGDDQEEPMRAVLEGFHRMKDDGILAYAKPTLLPAVAAELEGTARLSMFNGSVSGVAHSNLEVSAALNLIEDSEGLSEFDFTDLKLPYPVDMLRARIVCDYDLVSSTAQIQVEDGKVRYTNDAGDVKAKKIDDFEFLIFNITSELLQQFILMNFNPDEYSYSQLWYETSGKWAGDSFARVSEVRDLDAVSLNEPNILHLVKRHRPHTAEGTGGGVLSDSVEFDATSAAPAAAPAEPAKDIWDAAEAADADMPVPAAEESPEDTVGTAATLTGDAAPSDAETATQS